jgi:hypothetical protein
MRKLNLLECKKKLPFRRIDIVWSRLIHDESSLVGGKLSHVGIFCKIWTITKKRNFGFFFLLFSFVNLRFEYVFWYENKFEHALFWK